MSDLEKRTLVELRKMAKELGIPAISGLKKRELIEKIEQSSEVQKNDSVPRSAASDFSHRNFDEKTEAPQEHTEREKQFFEELGEGILEVLPDGYGFLRAENCLPGANDVYVVALADGGEVLLPAIKDCILSVDMEKREMQVHVLDGLL